MALLMTTNGATAITSTSATQTSIIPNCPDHNHVAAIAGGTVGGVLALVVLAMITWFLVSRKSKSKTHATTDSKAQAVSEQPPGEQLLRPLAVEQREPRYEFDNHAFYEAAAIRSPVEAGHTVTRQVELAS